MKKKQEQFFNHYFLNCKQQPFYLINKISKQFIHPTLTKHKYSKEVSFLKHYEKIQTFIKYISPPKNILVEINWLKSEIQYIYSQYLYFFKNQNLKQILLNKKELYLQQFLLIRLFIKNQMKINKLDQLVTSFFYTLNFIKSSNDQVKIFTKLLNRQTDLYTFSLFLSLKSQSILNANELHLLTSTSIKKICNIIDHNFDNNKKQDIKMNLSEAFNTLMQAKICKSQFKTYQLLKLASNPDDQNSNKWSQSDIFCRYVNQLNQLEQIIALQCASKLKQAANIFFNKSSNLKDQMIQQALGVMIQILVQIFQINQKNPSTKLYQIISQLYDYQVLVVSKITSSILLDTRIATIFQTYQQKINQII